MQGWHCHIPLGYPLIMSEDRKVSAVSLSYAFVYHGVLCKLCEVCMLTVACFVLCFALR